jgi:hypothetical protein
MTVQQVPGFVSDVEPTFPVIFFYHYGQHFPRFGVQIWFVLPYPLPHKYPFPYKLSPVPLEVVGKSLDYWMRAVSVYQLRCTNFFAHRVDDANLNHCICFHMFYV